MSSKDSQKNEDFTATCFKGGFRPAESNVGRAAKTACCVGSCTSKQKVFLRQNVQNGTNYIRNYLLFWGKLYINQNNLHTSSYAQLT